MKLTPKDLAVYRTVNREWDSGLAPPRVDELIDDLIEAHQTIARLAEENAKLQAERGEQLVAGARMEGKERR